MNSSLSLIGWDEATSVSSLSSFDRAKTGKLNLRETDALIAAETAQRDRRPKSGRYPVQAFGLCLLAGSVGVLVWLLA